VIGATLAATCEPSATARVAGEPGPLEARITVAAETLDLFWEPRLTQAGIAYSSPVVVPFDHGTVPATACAAGTDAEAWLQRGAWYCDADGTIALDREWIAGVDADAGPDAVTPVLAHEWTHHTQNLVGRPEFGLQAELQADCHAGEFLVQGRPDAFSALTRAMRQLVLAGNRHYDQHVWFDASEHGSPGLRLAAFEGGGIATLAGGHLDLCGAFGSYEPRPPMALGGYRVARIPGVEYIDDAGGITGSLGRARFRIEVLDRGILPGGTSLEQARAALEAHAPTAGLTWLADPIERGPDVLTDVGSWTTLYYAAQDAQDYYLGWFGLHVPETGDEVLIVRESTPREMERVDDPETTVSRILWFLATSYVCMPGASGEIGTPEYWFSCDIEHDV
jgi:predicted metalloprotease